MVTEQTKTAVFCITPPAFNVIFLKEGVYELQY